MRRRTFVSGVMIAAFAGLLCASVPVPAAAQNANVHVRVMTRNMDAGTDLNYVAGQTDETAFFNGLMQTIAEVEASNIPARAARVAAEIAENSPDLVALQEVTTWDFNDVFNGHRTYDQLALLQAALVAAGQHYRVVAVQQLTYIPVPAIPQLGFLGASFTDHNAILVRDDLPPGHLAVGTVLQGTYQYGLSFPSPLGEIAAPNGWMAVDVTVRGAHFEFVNTHLLSPSPGAFFDLTSQLQLAQGLELVQVLGGLGAPVILAGDFNSDAEQAGIGPDQTMTAPMITALGELTDAWHAAHPNLRGFTWALFPEDGQASTLSERIDLLLSRGVTPLAVHLTGLTPDADGVFASDHAGVVVNYLLGKY